MALPKTSVQIQHHTGFAHEIRVTRKEPVAILPRFEDVLLENSAQTGVTEAGLASLFDHNPLQISEGEAAQRQLMRLKGLAHQRHDLRPFFGPIGDWAVTGPAERRWRNRWRWFSTVCSQQPKISAVWMMVLPASANRMIRIRMTKRAFLQPCFLAWRRSCFSLPLSLILYL